MGDVIHLKTPLDPEREFIMKEAMLAADITSSKHQMRQVISHLRSIHGDGVTKCVLLELAAEFWPDEGSS